VVESGRHSGGAACNDNATGVTAKGERILDIWNIVKTVGAGIISTVVPGGPAIVGAINRFLPDENKLPENATGAQAINAINALPPDQRASLLEKQFDVDITQITESNSTVSTMLEADSRQPHTTRPKIALGAFLVVAFVCVLVTTIWAYGVYTGDLAMVKAVMDGWQFLLAVIGPLVTLLWAYFGILKKEHSNRLDAAGGNSSPGIVGLVSRMIKK